MSDEDAYVRAALAAAGLAVPEDWMPAVIANFRRTAEIAAIVNAFALADHDEPAPVFTP